MTVRNDWPGQAERCPVASCESLGNRWVTYHFILDLHFFLKFLSKNLTWLTLCNKAISFYEKNWRFIVAVSRDFLAFFSWIEPNWVPYKHVKILVNPKNSFSRRYLRNKWQRAESKKKKNLEYVYEKHAVFLKNIRKSKVDSEQSNTAQIQTPRRLTLHGVVPGPIFFFAGLSLPW